MKSLKTSLLLGVLVCCAIGLTAQNATTPKSASAPRSASAVLEYFDDNKQIKILNADGFEYGDVFLGMELLAGDRVQTAKSTVELRLNPNGSIIKISPNTDFQIVNLKNAAKGVNEFSLVTGKIRTVAAKAAGSNDYLFRTKTATAGVRGTDFGMEVQDGVTDRLIVREGMVDFTQTSSGKTLNVAAGSGADTFDPNFGLKPLTTQELADFFKGMDFLKLNPATVPSTPPSDAEALTPEATGDQQGAADTGSAPPAASESPSPTPSASPAPGSSAAPVPNAADALTDAALEMLKKFLGIEIGSILIDGKTYGKLIAQPRINLPDFKMQFYLPVLYQSELFNPATWYHPLGNNEWSFGTDQEGVVTDVVWDVVRDLILKIKYVELFKQGDPFFLKVGNIPSMTLGHGILIGGYANDSDFPAVRRLGVDIGLDVGAVAVEAMVNDLANPDIVGARLVWRPVAPTYKVGAGVSAAADLNPSGDLPVGSTDPAILGTIAAKPIFLDVAVDLEIPVFDSPIFGLMLFGDIAGSLPYFTNGFTSGSRSVSAGFQLDNLITLATSPSIGIEFKNYGIEVGIKGKVAIVDYRLEYQYFTGSFQPSYFDQSYDRTRGQKAVAIYQQFSNPSTTSPIRMGIYGNFGFDIANLMYFSLGYKWPWMIGNSEIVPDGNPDHLSARLYFVDDALPFGLGFSIGFDRQYFVPLFTRPSSYTFLDQYAVFSGRVEVPIGHYFKIRMTVGTATQRDSNGAVVLENGKVVMKPSFTIESVF